MSYRHIYFDVPLPVNPIFTDFSEEFPTIIFFFTHLVDDFPETGGDRFPFYVLC